MTTDYQERELEDERTPPEDEPEKSPHCMVCGEPCRDCGAEYERGQQEEAKYLGL